MKEEIERDIASDFEKAYNGILALPWKADLEYMLHINITSRFLKRSNVYIPHGY